MNSLKNLRLALAAAVITASALAAPAVQAQANLKIGYTSVQYVLSQMPESKQIESDLKAYNGQLEAQLKSKYADYQSKGEAYQKGEATMTDLVKADKQKELQSLQQSIQEFQRSAEQSLQQKQQSLLKPALDKLQKNIDAVAEESGYTYILNSDGDSPVLLHGPKDGDVSDLILKKMGITPQPAGTPRTAPAAQAPASMAPRATSAPVLPAGKVKTKSK